MCPGRFPSPTPPRDMSPDTSDSPLPERRTFRSPISQIRTPTQPSSPERNFTAKKDFRKNPQFAQSNSALLSSGSPHHSPDSYSPNVVTAKSPSSQRIQDSRRASEPLRHQRQGRGQTGPDSTPTPQQKRRKVSDNPIHTPYTIQCPGLEREERPSCTSDQHAGPPTKSPRFSNTYSSDKKTADEKDHAIQSPNSGQSNRGDRSEQRSRSPRKPQTAKDLYGAIRSRMRKDVKEKSRKNGIIYIYRHPKDSTWGYKIGSTSQAELRLRMNQHESRCGFAPDVVYQSRFEFECCARTEKLIQLDLRDYWHSRSCNTHDGAHDEWFNVSKELAVQTVEKWESIMMTAIPYDWEGKLKPVWRHILNTRRPKLPANGNLTHDSRREQWIAILAPPTITEYIATYKKIITDTTPLLTAFFWQGVALFYSLSWVAHSHNKYNLTAFTMLLCCAGIGVSSRIKL